MFEKLIPYDASHIILAAYSSYYRRFKRVTRRARIRFEHRDWHGIQQDAVKRQLIYRDEVGNCKEELQAFLGDQAGDRDIWRDIKKIYFEEISNFNTRNIAETFYNSVFRHSNQNVSADSELMFVYSTGSYYYYKSRNPIYHTFDFTSSIAATLERILSLYPFDTYYEDLARDVERMAKVFSERMHQLNVDWRYLRLEVLKSVFFRNKGAYIVGRLYVHDSPIPFVIPLLNRAKGIFVDALLLDYKDVSSIFSYHRSYFLVDTDIVSEMVLFLQTILPTKNLGELYSSIGFEKHGKTVFYRDFLRHLIRSEDKFVVAPGIKGMVMSVFTLPSYNVVFKLIKDRFDPPKKVTEKQVKEKYELVSQHDRVGRMTDCHNFANLRFDKRRFHPDLLEELLKVAPSKVIINEAANEIEIKQLYVEKRMIPLNIYLETATEEECRHVINEYGNAIKELCAVNIFPGDLLLKNFGVTRLNRVVFYDYDEIGFLTDYNFRRLPDPRDDEDEFSSTPNFHVGENDIFPEEFLNFLIGDLKIRSIFTELHGDLFSPKFWRNTQKRLRKREIIDVYPYRTELRFEQRFDID